MKVTRPKIRLFVGVALISGEEINLSRDQAHYVARVMRQVVGAPALLFNGCDGEWLARISNISKTQCQLTIESQTRSQTDEPDVWLAFSPIKKSRMDFLIEKATELGVSRLLPVFTQNTDVSRVNVERLQATAVEASEQCERLSVPVVAAPVDLRELISEWTAPRHLYFMDETGRGKPVIPSFSLSSSDNDSAAILIGPEGGFTVSELDQLRDLAFSTSVVLGPRVLRAETAALMAVSSWQIFNGDACAIRER